MTRFRKAKEAFFSRAMLLATLLAGSLVPLMAVALYVRFRPILAEQPLWKLLFSSDWQPMAGKFGLLPFIMGTFWVTLVAMAIAVPLSLLTAAYLAEYARPWVRAALKPLVDLLAGIPSVVYGVWGLLVVVPLIQTRLAPFAQKHFPRLPLLSADNSTGFSVLAGGIVLAIMVFPIIISVSEEVLRAVSRETREASFCLGASRWQTVRHVVARKALPGLLAAVILGFSRAFGETMAVLMVVGNVPKAPHSVFDPAYPLPALIANNYGEMMSIPLYDSALMGVALVLMGVVLVFNLLARGILVRAVRSAA